MIDSAVKSSFMQRPGVTLIINGGLVIASGSSSPEEGLDCDNSQNFIVKGGTLTGNFVCLYFCGWSTDNIEVFGTFGHKTLAIMLICIGDGIRDSLLDLHRSPCCA